MNPATSKIAPDTVYEDAINFVTAFEKPEGSWWLLGKEPIRDSWWMTETRDKAGGIQNRFISSPDVLPFKKAYWIIPDPKTISMRASRVTDAAASKFTRSFPLDWNVDRGVTTLQARLQLIRNLQSKTGLYLHSHDRQLKDLEYDIRMMRRSDGSDPELIKKWLVRTNQIIKAIKSSSRWKE